MSTQTPAVKRGSWLQAVKAVAWSFVGLRSRAGMDTDMARLHPLHIVAVALLGAVLFVLALALFVQWVAG